MRNKKGEFLYSARRCAKAHQMTMCQIYVERAFRVAPLTEMQWFSISTLTGGKFVRELRIKLKAWPEWEK